MLTVPTAVATLGLPFRRLWAGFGLGFLSTSLGRAGATSGTVTVTADETSILSVLISPRVGYDFYVSPGLSIGAFASYNYSSGTVKVSYIDTSGPTSLKLDEDFTRSWFAFNVRAGFDF